MNCGSGIRFKFGILSAIGMIMKIFQTHLSSPSHSPHAFAWIILFLGFLHFQINTSFAMDIFRLAQEFNEVASDSPAFIPEPQTSQEEYQNLCSRFEQFRQAIPNHHKVELNLTCQDMNTLMMSALRIPVTGSKFQLKFEGGHLLLNTSIPMNMIPGFVNRYLNPTITFDASVVNGSISTTLLDMAANGKTMSGSLADLIRTKFQQQVTQQLNEHPLLAPILSQIQSIRIENDKLVIQAVRSTEMESMAKVTWADPVEGRSSLDECSWLSDYAAALEQAKAENKLVMLYFSGPPSSNRCVSFEREVLNQKAFNALSQKFVLVQASYDSCMSKGEMGLAQSYGVPFFPQVLVANSKGHELTRLGYMQGGFTAFSERLDDQLRSRSMELVRR